MPESAIIYCMEKRNVSEDMAGLGHRQTVISGRRKDSDGKRD